MNLVAENGFSLLNTNFKISPLLSRLVQALAGRISRVRRHVYDFFTSFLLILYAATVSMVEIGFVCGHQDALKACDAFARSSLSAGR